MSAALHHVTARAFLDDPVTTAAAGSELPATGGSQGGKPKYIPE